jgi:hypothetical protein
MVSSSLNPRPSAQSVQSRALFFAHQLKPLWRGSKINHQGTKITKKHEGMQEWGSEKLGDEAGPY